MKNKTAETLGAVHTHTHTHTHTHNTFIQEGRELYLILAPFLNLQVRRLNVRGGLIG